MTAVVSTIRSSQSISTRAMNATLSHRERNPASASGQAGT
jgi:hypothetical protein